MVNFFSVLSGAVARVCLSALCGPPYEPAPGNFAAVPSVDFSLANYRYVAVNAAP